jgi:DUF4097 and DUF4098 domain-containing protein YvlB
MLRTHLIEAFFGLGAAASALLGSIFGGGEERRETFEQTCPLGPGGLVSLDAYTGVVRVRVWERDEVRIEAVKTAYAAERMAEASVEVEAGPGAVRVATKFAQPNLRWSDKGRERGENSARVDYELTVPRRARLEKVVLHNGRVEIEGCEGGASVSTTNAGVKLGGLAGDVSVSTINGRIEAEFGELDKRQRVLLSSINGAVVVGLASDKVWLNAGTVHGRVRNELGRAREADGPRVELSNVNGDITVRRAPANR